MNTTTMKPVTELKPGDRYWEERQMWDWSLARSVDAPARLREVVAVTTPADNPRLFERYYREHPDAGERIQITTRKPGAKPNPRFESELMLPVDRMVEVI